MKLKIENLGPIEEGEIELGDVTLFVGPNGTGKSLALKALYSNLMLLDGYALYFFAEKLEDRLASTISRKMGGKWVKGKLLGLMELAYAAILALLYSEMQGKTVSAETVVEAFDYSIGDHEARWDVQVSIPNEKKLSLSTWFEINLSKITVDKTLKRGIRDLVSKTFPNLLKRVRLEP